MPVPIVKDTTYITSYHSSLGQFAFSSGYFFGGVDNAPLHAPADSLAGGNGVYKYGASAFPDSTFNATNYWVDAVFEQIPGADTRRPLISDVSPAAGATGLPATTKVTATFDEPLDPLTVNAGSFTLADGDGNAGGGSGDLRLRHAEGHAHAPGSARAREDLHRHGQERHRRSGGPVGQPAGRGQDLVLQHVLAVPLHGLRGRRRSARRRQQRSAGRGGDEVPLGRGRLHHGAALLQAAQQHGLARGAPVVRHRRAPGGGHVHRRDRLGVAAGGPAQPGADHEGHHLHHVLLRERRALRRSAPATSTRASTVRPCTLPAPRPPAATASTSTGPAPSPIRPSTRPTTGSMRPSTAPSRRTRAGRRSRSRRPRPAPPTFRPRSRSLRPSTSRSPPRASPARTSRSATRTATWSRPT